MTETQERCPNCGAPILRGACRPLLTSASDDRPTVPLGHDHGDGIGSGTFPIPASLILPDPIAGGTSIGELADQAIAPVRPQDAESPFAAIGGIDLAGSRPTLAPIAAEPAGGDSQEVVYLSGPSWPLLLLGSYASAATLALIWWVVLPRFRSEPVGSERFFAGSPPALIGTRPTVGPLRVEESPAIPPELTTNLGRPLTVGQLEITPIDVSRRDVQLVRAAIAGGTQRREGGLGALALRIKLRNLSKDTVFAPLGPEFLRDKDDGSSDSFVELGPSDRVYLYPLPIESEWSIVGQDFPVLKPGESRDALIVTGADFPASAGGLFWCLRVRTGLEGDSLIGIKTN